MALRMAWRSTGARVLAAWRRGKAARDSCYFNPRLGRRIRKYGVAYISPTSPGRTPGLADSRSPRSPLATGALVAGNYRISPGGRSMPRAGVVISRTAREGGNRRGISDCDGRHPVWPHARAASRRIRSVTREQGGARRRNRSATEAPDRPPPRVMGVFMGFTFRRVREGFSSTYVFRILEEAHRGCAADAAGSCAAQYVARLSPPRYIRLPGDAACAVYARYKAYTS